MDKIIVSKKEYQNLINKSLRYDCFRQIMEEDFFSSPPTKNSKEIIKEFRDSGKYNKDFIKSLSRGLRRSSYFK